MVDLRRQRLSRAWSLDHAPGAAATGMRQTGCCQIPAQVDHGGSRAQRPRRRHRRQPGRTARRSRARRSLRRGGAGRARHLPCRTRAPEGRAAVAPPAHPARPRPAAARGALPGSDGRAARGRRRVAQLAARHPVAGCGRVGLAHGARHDARVEPARAARGSRPASRGRAAERARAPGDRGRRPPRRRRGQAGSRRQHPRPRRRRWREPRARCRPRGRCLRLTVIRRVMAHAARPWRPRGDCHQLVPWLRQPVLRAPARRWVARLEGPAVPAQRPGRVAGRWRVPGRRWPVARHPRRGGARLSARRRARLPGLRREPPLARAPRRIGWPLDRSRRSGCIAGRRTACATSSDSRRGPRGSSSWATRPAASTRSMDRG